MLEDQNPNHLQTINQTPNGIFLKTSHCSPYELGINRVIREKFQTHRISSKFSPGESQEYRRCYGQYYTIKFKIEFTETWFEMYYVARLKFKLQVVKLSSSRGSADSLNVETTTPYYYIAVGMVS